MKYHQLTEVERYQIQAGIDLGFNVKDISVRLKRHRSTIFRELKRNGHISREGYSAIYSQQQYHERRKKCRRRFVVSGALKHWVNTRIKLQWSPEQISGRRKLEGLSTVSTETLYRYLYRDKLAGGDLWRNLRHSSGHRKKRFKTPRWPTSNARLSADTRPSIINERGREGDFERDLIVGANHSGHIMTVVDRKTKLLRIRKIERPTAQIVHSATVDALKDLNPRSITNDNGREFFAHKETSKHFGIRVYFTRPYAAWERGTVENTNKLIRQYFPKKTNLKEISNEKIKMVETLLNYRPRKLLGFRTPIEASA